MCVVGWCIFIQGHIIIIFHQPVAWAYMESREDAGLGLGRQQKSDAREQSLDSQATIVADFNPYENKMHKMIAYVRWSVTKTFSNNSSN